MGWVTISLRKMALKQRVSMLQYRDMQISQERQSLALQSQYTQQSINVMKNKQFGDITNGQLDAMARLQKGAENIDPNSKDWTAYQNSLDQVNLVQKKQEMAATSIFQGYENSLMGDVNRRDQQLEAEQTQVETQLQAAQAEVKNLEDAIKSSIEDSAIKLT